MKVEYPNIELVLPKTVIGKAKYRLCSTLRICGYEVPSGFVSDGSTVLRLFWWLFPAVSSYFWATVVHDYLLTLDANRRVADLALKKVMIHEKVSKPVIAIKMFFVTIYGFIKAPKDYLQCIN